MRSLTLVSLSTPTPPPKPPSQTDFWSPENAEQVVVDMNVDIHVPALYLDLVQTQLQQSGMEHKWVSRTFKNKNLFDLFSRLTQASFSGF